MSMRTKLSGLKPDLLVRYEDGKRLEARYGRSAVRPWTASFHATQCCLDLLPDSVDVRCGTVVDVGANIGAWTASLLTVVPTASVLVVEPAGQPLEHLRNRFAGDARVDIAEFAVSDRSEVAMFHTTVHSHNSSLQVPRDMDAHYGSGWEPAGTVSVRTITLDELTSGHEVSLVKIDVQGAERKVLAGGHATLAKAHAVLIEVTLQSHYEGDCDFPELHGLMTDLDYALCALAAPKKNGFGEILWMDAMYVRRSRA